MSKLHSFKTSGESWAFWTFISHQWIARLHTTTEFPGCLVSCHSLHNCSQKPTSYWKICDSHHDPPPCRPWDHSLVRMSTLNILYCFYFCCAPSLQFCYRRDVPLGRPGSLVEIPKEKCSAKFLLLLQISVISAIDFVAPSNFLSVVWLGLSRCTVNFNKCCCPLPVMHRDLQSLCCDHTCKITFSQRQSSWPSVSCPSLAENLSSSQLSSVHSFASWAHC